ncbi:alpha/beta fold hydrolase [Kutzneria buriramensis]|uniref:Pimeloyl-ACP methyl ester carboxylesterase n=1 Tax=Kutzneria buriramensis TaxID=1045776 RepID=A0A3E0HEF8_9PSEU|nr:alpha/beta hydrolase [Kutzneria buriramensis]REH43598.1 pimeloyl-ACP methyl ester carboxylesterase [Kutzneria buriramensis]
MSTELAFRSSAGTGRTVVFLHGNSSSSSTWQGLLDGPFGQRFHCLALDLPGHGGSRPADDYSVPAHASALAEFLQKNEDVVVVGWSLGGHITLHAANALTRAAGFVIFGTPPIETAASLAEGFLPNPAFNTGFQGEISPEEALAYAKSMLAPDSAVSPDVLVPDILATDPGARTGLGASVAEGRFVDEVEVIANLSQPLLVLHGAEDQLVSLDYLRKLDLPVEVFDGIGHAIQLEAPDLLARRLTEFVEGL